MEYIKTPKTPEQQVDILQKRGLVFHNPEYAARKLQFINYYRFSSYCLHFEIPSYTDPAQRSHQFKPNTTFEEVLKCYEFDSRLRQLTLSAIEILEVAIRTQICLKMALNYNNPHWHLCSYLFNDVRSPKYGRFSLWEKSINDQTKCISVFTSESLFNQHVFTLLR